VIIASGDDDFTITGEEGHTTELCVVNAEVVGLVRYKIGVVDDEGECKQGEVHLLSHARGAQLKEHHVVVEYGRELNHRWGLEDVA
jgi:hypothetical protein